MAADYRKQYTPQQLEPFWPNEILRMVVVVLCTLAIIMALAVLPVALDFFGLGGLLEEEQPADPRATPAHIRPEWYFLAVYQYLKLPPQELLGMSGKTVGVLSQAPFVLALLLVQFWTRRWRLRRPGLVHTFLVTLIVANFTALTFWAIWPPHLLFTGFFTATLVVFYVMLLHERRKIRRILDQPKDRAP